MKATSFIDSLGCPGPGLLSYPARYSGMLLTNVSCLRRITKPWAIDLRALISTVFKVRQAFRVSLRPSPIRTVPSVPVLRRLNRIRGSWTCLSALPPVGNWLGTPASPCPEDLHIGYFFCLNTILLFSLTQDPCVPRLSQVVVGTILSTLEK